MKRAMYLAVCLLVFMVGSCGQKKMKETSPLFVVLQNG